MMNQTAVTDASDGRLAFLMLFRYFTQTVLRVIDLRKSNNCPQFR